MLIENMEIEEFIKPEEIEGLLRRGKETPDSEIDRILDKAEKFGGLTHLEVASLLKMDDKHLGRLFRWHVISRKRFTAIVL
jgi:2-iminoacetate synthase